MREVRTNLRFPSRNPLAKPTPSLMPSSISNFQFDLFHSLTDTSTSSPCPLPSPLVPDLDYTHTIPSTCHLENTSSTISSCSFDSDCLMTTGYPHQPQIRVQKSTPSPGVARAIFHSSVLDEAGRSPALWPRLGNTSSLTSQLSHQRLGLGASHPVHERQSSTSSTTSAGPVSPYTSVLSYPQIIDSDNNRFPSPGIDAFDNTPLTFQKSHFAFNTTFSDSFLSPAFQDYYPSSNDVRYGVAMRETMTEAMRSQQSTTSGLASDALPGSYGEDYEDGFKVPMDPKNTMPRLNRTMSDIYQDELYNPSIIAPMPAHRAVASTPNRGVMSPRRDVFSECLQAATNDHLSARSGSPATTISRERSPFLPGSDWAAEGFSQSNSPAPRLASAAQLREAQKAKMDLTLINRASNKIDLETPKTISPKEAFLDCEDIPEARSLPFAPERVRHSAARFAPVEQESSQSDDALQSFRSVGTTRHENSSNCSMAMGSGQAMSGLSSTSQATPRVPQQYPFISRRQNSLTKSNNDQVPEFHASLTSMESTASDNDMKSLEDRVEERPDIQRPANTTSDSGTYTCTYHGCTMRFETPSKLQKHKRDGHRLSTPQTPSIGSSNALLAANRNSQAGPHKCERLNPSTGKPCDSVFSRPYDLTRHEDTIHNARKQKVRCQICTDEKTFSRNDALARHMRVVHPDVTFLESKQRRK